SAPPATLPRPRRSLIPSVPRTVLALGMTSLLTDVSSEMVSTVLPLYFMVYLGLSPIQFGIVDGLYQAPGPLPPAPTRSLSGCPTLRRAGPPKMVRPFLPLYFMVYLGLSPIQFGIVDGLYQGAGALVRVASGFLSDRMRRAKEVAFVGYAISALCKLGLLAAGGPLAMTAVVVAARTGTGSRNAPRDAP